jgi:Flp pilus assembly protein TadG
MIRAPTRRLRALGADAAGATLVEYALIFPVLVLVLLGLIQVAGLVLTQSTLSYAVEEASRCAAVRPDICGTPDQIQTYAASLTSGLDVPASAFSVTTDACGQRIRAQATYTFLVSDLLPTPPTLTADVCRA